MSKRKQSPTKDAGQHRILPILFALVASIPSSQCLRIDPARTEFKKTQTPENGAVKQYSRIDRTQSRRGKFFMNASTPLSLAAPPSESLPPTSSRRPPCRPPCT